MGKLEREKQVNASPSDLLTGQPFPTGQPKDYLCNAQAPGKGRPLLPQVLPVTRLTELDILIRLSPYCCMCIDC